MEILVRNGANINEKDVKIFQFEKQMILRKRESEQREREGVGREKAERRRKGAGIERRRKNF